MSAILDLKKHRQAVYGIALCIAIGLVALLLTDYIPIGTVTISIIVGMIVGNTFKLDKKFAPGIKFSEKQILAFAIALLCLSLDYLVLEKLGLRSILLVIVGMALTITTSVVLAKLFKLDSKLALLLGIGNGVCGSSAIAATEQIIGAESKDVGLSIAIVNFLGTIGIFLLPIIATALLHLTNINAGLLIGNTLQAVGQVVAAGFAVSDVSGQTATIVKMARILMLTPMIFILIYIFTSRRAKTGGVDQTKAPTVPLFIVGFIVFSLIPTFHLLPKTFISAISQASHYALIVAMAGIGLKTTIASILRDGRSALLIGSLTFVVQIIFTSSVILLLMQ